MTCLTSSSPSSPANAAHGGYSAPPPGRQALAWAAIVLTLLATFGTMQALLRSPRRLAQSAVAAAPLPAAPEKSGGWMAGIRCR